MSPIQGLSVTSTHYTRVEREACEQIHQASLAILERTGVRLYYQEAIDLLESAGASVSDGNRVRIPARLVERALSTVPKELTLYDRNGEPALFLEEGRCYYGPGSDCLNILDHRTGERRKPVLHDVVEGVTVCDALPHIGFVMSMFLPVDVDPMVADRYQMEAMLNGTTKPIIYVTNEFSGCADAVEMAEIVAGGAAALADHPFVTCYINVTTGLRHNEEALQKLLFLASKNLPAMYIPVVIAGLSGPATIAGSTAVTMAGMLTGLVLSQLKREGAPFMMQGWTSDSLDMRTMVLPYCAPNSRGLATALSRYYGLPSFGLGGASESKLVDGQAAAEAALTLMAETLSGGNLIHDLGYLESGLMTSLAQLVLCDEMVGWISHFVPPVEVNDETLALDLIDEIGPDGQFLETPHTLAHYRDHWYPGVFDRRTWDRWFEMGGKSAEQRAVERVNKILDEHCAESLPLEVAQGVHGVVSRAERLLGIK